MQSNTSPSLGWWLSWTAIPTPPSTAPLAERELARRTQIGSTSLLIIFICGCVPMINAIQSGNVPFFVTLAVTLIVFLLALVGFNRRGHTAIAGLLSVGVLNIGFMLYVFGLSQANHGFAFANIPSFAILLESIVAGAAFFDEIGIVITALLNLIIVCWVVFSLPQQPDLAHALQSFSVRFDVISIPVIVFFLVAAFSRLLMRSANQAIKRADNAEELAELAGQRAELQRKELERGMQIEEGIQVLMSTLAQASEHRDFSARVPLSKENILWRVGRAVNLLLSRLQNYKSQDEQMAKIDLVAKEFAECIRRGQPYMITKWTGTSFDAVIMEYNNKLRPQPPQPPQPPQSRSTPSQGPTRPPR